MADLTVARITSRTELEELSGPLGELAAASGAGVVNHPTFFLPWCKTVAANGLRHACIALWRGNDLVAFAPFFLKPARMGLTPARLSPPLYGSSPPFDILLAEAHETLLPLIAETAHSFSWDSFHLPFAHAESVIAKPWIDTIARHNTWVERQEREGSAICNLPPSGSLFRDNLSKKTRRNLRTCELRIDAPRFECITEPDEGEAALAAMHDILEKSWKGSETMRRSGWPLMRRLAHSLLSAGKARIWLLWSRNHPIAYQFEISESNTSILGFHNAYSDDYAAVSPGFVLLAHGVGAAADEGFSTYDFGGARGYLLKFSSGVAPTVSVAVRRNTTRAQLRRKIDHTGTALLRQVQSRMSSTSSR